MKLTLYLGVLLRFRATHCFIHFSLVEGFFLGLEIVYRIKSILTCILRHEWYFNLPHKSFLFYNLNPCYFKNTQKSLNMLNNNLPFLIGLNSCSYFEDPFLLYLAVCVAGLCITLVFISNIPFSLQLVLLHSYSSYHIACMYK